MSKTKTPLKNQSVIYIWSRITTVQKLWAVKQPKTIIRVLTIRVFQEFADISALISIEALKRGRKAIDYLRIIVHWKYALPRQLVYNFGCLSLKIVKLALHVLEMGFCIFVSATVIALPKNHPRGVLFWLFVYFIFSEMKTQNFRDDALPVQEIYSFIHGLLNKCFQPVSLTDYFSLPPTYLRVAAIKINS